MTTTRPRKERDCKPLTEKQREIQLEALNNIMQTWPLLRSIFSGVLVDTIHTHGPINHDFVSSTLKRMKGAIRSARDGMHSQEKQPT